MYYFLLLQQGIVTEKVESKVKVYAYYNPRKQYMLQKKPPLMP